MKGRIFPKVNNAFVHSVSSYIQVNIYDTNLEDLQARGVNLKQILQQYGCRSVILDVPIISEEIRKTVALPRRFKKSFGGFFRTGKTRHSKGTVDQEATSHSNETCTSDEDELNDVSGKEFVDCRSSFAANVVKDNEHQVKDTVSPTSRPLPCKGLKSPSLFSNANTFVDSSAAISDCSVKNTVGSLFNRYCDVELSNSVNKLQPDEEDIIESENSISHTSTDLPVAESSFMNFRTAIIEGLKSVNDNSTALSDNAMLRESCSPAADPGAHLDKTKEYGEIIHLDEQQHSRNHDQRILPLERPLLRKYARKTSLNAALSFLEKVSDESTPIPEDTDLSCDRKNSSERSLKKHHSSPQGFCRSASTEAVETSFKHKSAAAVKTKFSGSVLKRGHPQTAKLTDELVSIGTENKHMEHNLTCENVAKRKSTSKVTTRVSEDERIYECQLPLCQKKLMWRPRYGKNRLVDHVRTHWNKTVKKCKLCDYKASSLRKVHYHHSNAHPGEVYRGALSTESKEDLDELLDLWTKCFPSLQLSTSRVLSFR